MRGARPPKLDDGTPDVQHTDAARPSGSSGTRVATADRWRRIARAAYLRAERRGFAGDAALEDWLEAEQEVDLELTNEAAAENSSRHR
jgi:hypothetical protein